MMPTTTATRKVKGRAVRRPPSPKDAGTLAKEQRAFELRVRQKTYAEIAEDIGYCDKSAARKAVLRAIAYAQEHLAETVAETMRIQIDSYRTVAAHLYPLVTADPPIMVDKWIAVMTRIDKLSGLENRPVALTADAAKIIDALTEAQDWGALDRIIAGESPYVVAVERLAATTSSPSP